MKINWIKKIKLIWSSHCYSFDSTMHNKRVLFQSSSPSYQWTMAQLLVSLTSYCGFSNSSPKNVNCFIAKANKFLQLFSITHFKIPPWPLQIWNSYLLTPLPHPPHTLIKGLGLTNVFNIDKISCFLLLTLTLI